MFYGLAGPRVCGLHRLEQMQHMFGAIRRPQSKQTVMGVLQSAAAT